MRHLYLPAACLLLGSAAWLPAPALAQAPAVSFAPVAGYTTQVGGLAAGLVVADVNEDGSLDLLRLHTNPSVLEVQLGTGPGSFSTLATFDTGVSTGSVAMGMAVADVNGDGHLDVLTTSHAVSVLLGTGTGSFGPATLLANGPVSPYGIVVADFNNDGKPDLLTSFNGSRWLRVQLGTGPGSFGNATGFSTDVDSLPQGMAVADVDGDGNLDLLLVGRIDGEVAVMPGTGTGSFGAATIFPAGSPVAYATLRVADVNNDGRPDILTARQAADGVSVLLNTGAGSFAAPTFYSTGYQSFPRNVAVGDLNGDGQPDLLVSHWANILDVLPGLGAGIFGPATSFAANPTPAGAQPDFLTAADVNNDGRLDMVFASTGFNNNGVLLNTTAFAAYRGFDPAIAYGTGAGSEPRALVVADVTGDGRPDALTANSGTNTISVLPNTGRGRLGAATSFATGPGSSPAGLAVADVTGDGRSDLLTANAGNSTVGVLRGMGAGTFGPVALYSSGAGSQPTALAVADVDRDGKPDVLTANPGSSTVSVLLGTGGGSLGAAVPYSTGAGTQPTALAVADVNRDGRLDILTANAGTSTLSVLLGTGSGNFGAAVSYSTGPGSPVALTIADLNRDGKPDALTTGNDDTVHVLLGNGTGGFGAALPFSIGSGSSPAGLVVADLNRDGKPDVLTANSGAGTVALLLGDGTGSLAVATPYSAGPGAAPAAVAVADLNSDGRLDLLATNPSGHSLALWLSSSAPLATPAAALPGTTATLAPNPAATGSTLTATNLPAGARSLTVTLRDALGRELRRLAVPAAAGAARAEVPTTGLPAGVYLLRLEAADAQGGVLGALPTQRLAVE